MPQLRNIPLTYKEGVYSVVDFSKDIDEDNAISFDYDTQYQILTYDIPVGKGKREMTLYSVPEDELIRTLRAVYGKDETLQNVTVSLNGHETFCTSIMKTRNTLSRKFGNLPSEMQMPLLSKSNNAQIL